MDNYLIDLDFINELCSESKKFVVDSTSILEGVNVKSFAGTELSTIVNKIDNSIERFKASLANLDVWISGYNEDVLQKEISLSNFEGTDIIHNEVSVDTNGLVTSGTTVFNNMFGVSAISFGDESVGALTDESKSLSSYPYNQCTWYAAARAITYYGDDGLASELDNLGNGQEWANNYAAKGGEVTMDKSNVAAGDIISMTLPGSPYGHVVFVESVNEDGSIVISEGNYNGDLHNETYASVDALLSRGGLNRSLTGILKVSNR